MRNVPSPFRFDDSYARALPELAEPWRAESVPAPSLVVANASLASELGIPVDWVASEDGLALLAGNALAPGSVPIAMAYAGHQFGGYSPRLGDGRALLLGEAFDRSGRRLDLHLKGSGRTPFARGGDGKAAIGPMLREFLMGEAMHALGIPTTRALAVIATGEWVVREEKLPGAVLVRLAASHLRVGTFEYAASTGDRGLLRRLLDYAIERHFPEAARAEVPALAFYDAVVARQAELVARWMAVGFIHGVMNTDNTTISGETIDYGPCAFMDRHDPRTVFSSIDHGGRYAYGNQPGILQWNLARLAEALLPLIDEDESRAVARATAILEAFAQRFQRAWQAALDAKLGLRADRADSAEAIALREGLSPFMTGQKIDHTLFFRRLAGAVRGDDAPVRALFEDPKAFDAWAEDWRALLPSGREERAEVASAMDRVNPIYVPRNHRVEAALEAATAGDLAPFHTLLGVLEQPFEERPGLEAFSEPAPADAPPYRTYCGT
ncbi:MAG: YdiU family protein [Myxococcota bacterium]